MATTDEGNEYSDGPPTQPRGMRARVKAAILWLWRLGCCWVSRAFRWARLAVKTAAKWVGAVLRSLSTGSWRLATITALGTLGRLRRFPLKAAGWTALGLLFLVGACAWALRGDWPASIEVEKDRIEARLKVLTLGVSLVAAVGGGLALWYTHRRVRIAERNTTFAEEAAHAQRYATAVDLLSKGEAAKGVTRPEPVRTTAHLRSDDGLTLRLGGIYILREVLRASPPLYWPCVDVLVAYLTKHCVNVPWNPQDGDWPGFDKPHEDFDPDYPADVAPDIQAAVAAIGARVIVDESRPVYLCRLELRWVSFEGANLRNVCFHGSDLYDARFDGADVRQCDFDWTNIEGYQLKNAMKDGTTKLPP